MNKPALISTALIAALAFPAGAQNLGAAASAAAGRSAFETQAAERAMEICRQRAQGLIPAAGEEDKAHLWIAPMRSMAWCMGSGLAREAQEPAPSGLPWIDEQGYIKGWRQASMALGFQPSATEAAASAQLARQWLQAAIKAGWSDHQKEALEFIENLGKKAKAPAAMAARDARELDEFCKANSGKDSAQLRFACEAAQERQDASDEASLIGKPQAAPVEAQEPQGREQPSADREPPQDGAALPANKQTGAAAGR